MTHPAPLPEDERQRLERLRSLAVLDTAPEPLFDTLTRLAAAVCGVPIALVSLIDAERQWFKSNVGLTGIAETPRDLAFCSHAIVQPGLMEVPDATLDARFANNPLVTSDPDIRFYAGAPITLNDGTRMGTLCAIDRQPRQLDEVQRKTLTELAAAAAQALEMRERVLGTALRARSEFEYALAGNGDMLTRLLEGLPVGVGYFGPDLALRYANRVAAEWAGRKPAEMPGVKLPELVGPSAWQRNRGRFEAALAGQPQSYVSWIDAPAGRRDIQVELLPELTPDRQRDGFLVMLTDITAQVRNQAVEARYRALIEDQSDLVSLSRTDGRLTFVNRAYAQQVGSTPEAMEGRSLFEFVAEADRAEVAAHLRAVCEGRTVAAGENRMMFADGRQRWVSWTLRALLDEQGRVTGIHAVGRDVTDRRHAERQLKESRAFLDRTGRVAGVGGWEIDLQTRTVTWSDQTCRIHGLQPGHVPTHEEAMAFYPAEARGWLEGAFAQAVATGTPWDLELPLVTADGRPIWVRVSGEAEFEQGRPARVFGAFQDISLRKQIEAELAEKHELLSVTLKSIGDAVITTDAHGRLQWMNPVAERMTGWPVSEAHGLPLTHVFHIVHEQTRAPAENPVVRCLAEQEMTGLAHHTLLIARDGKEYGIEDSAAPIRDHKGRLLGAVLVFHDVSEQRRISTEMSFRATHDDLTGLYNRAEFEARLERVLTRSREDRSANAMMYIDLDQFKLVNDACGHAMGDQLLCQVSDLLRASVRTRDTLARLGGDEFGLIMEHCTVEQAQRVAQQICDKMEDFRFTHEARRFRIGTSIGLVPVDQRWTHTASVLQAADTSCYAAKEAGRNRVHAWFDTDQAMRARRGEAQWASRLEQALDEDRFVLYAQRIVPILPVARDTPAPDAPPDRLHFEVLVRLRDTDGSIIPPGAFLPAAERFHMASRIDRWVVRRVFQWLADGGDALDHVETVSVNLSGQSIGDRAFHRFVVELLDEIPVGVGKLCLEVTETAAITNLADATVFIDAMRKLGVRMALDDFGAGASSFGYLKALAVDYLKIDGQFIRELTTDPLDRAAVRCFHEVARVIGVKTIAEFVEHASALEVLREIGVDFAQGYLVHKPEPLEDLIARTGQAPGLQAPSAALA